MTVVYLGGPINNSDDPHTWRDRAVSMASCNTINPLTAHDFSGDKYTPEDVVAADIQLLKKCDSVLFKREENVETWGTPMEVQWAHERGYRIVCYDPYDSETSAWIRSRSVVFDSLVDAVAAVCQ